ncbi:phosphoribosylamine--glycine ligase [Oceanirhabdus sp. W0125-5]|uniref:phosphoribosylamine--glycine ligase n=1 Tax=Oceanirhabdus sp. W0125-5 TaxID=2999116 RepID=UPI0022F33CAE|nr:phosphoribosylamine--glycine ligase [Oceanirhabdus sp. W0125-5]WBW95725.1 phosphoribosylamine--glycine ligase [Oceanirhabdus sp. W0125-5]
MKFLVIGSGGREHAIAWKIAQSESCDKVFVAPGNGGTALENKCENFKYNSFDDLIDLCKREKIDLTVVGPEAPLVDGVVDAFTNEGLSIIGPHKEAAVLEGSKIFAKDFMKKHGIKTAKYESFDDYNKAVEFIDTMEYPIVIKADGLAAGKGVVIAGDKDEAIETLKEFMLNERFNEAGKSVVVEEFLEGVEASIVTLFDGEKIIPFISCKDHKRAHEGDEGPNTGGMGVVSPNLHVNEEVMNDFINNIMEPTLTGLKNDKLTFKGFIFFGIMIKNGVSYLLEYNVRMGDPETQAIMSLMESDFASILKKCMDNSLEVEDISWKDKHCCAVVLASGGYPLKYKKGIDIQYNDNLQEESKVFFAGAEVEDSKLRTSGGRVACVTAIGNDSNEAYDKAYESIENVQFDGMFFRKDIGKI